MDKELENYIEENGYVSSDMIGDFYECAGGHIWHIDEIKKEMKENSNDE
jgi:hypothetical protein